MTIDQHAPFLVQTCRGKIEKDLLDYWCPLVQETFITIDTANKISKAIIQARIGYRSTALDGLGLTLLDQNKYRNYNVHARIV